jgi:membrane-bound metal-dependent hydrolase YbcI (DUF457 family)
MDPLSHAALGRILGTVADVARERRRGGTAAAIVGALSPDLDAVFMPLGWDRYLRVHEIGTHTLVGTVVSAAIAAAVVRRFAPDARWKALGFCAWLGSASHVLLDVLSSARIRIFWPFFDRQLSVPLVAMADPWLAAILVAGLPLLLLTTRQRKAGAILLTIGALFLAVKAALAVQAVGSYTEAQRAAAPALSYMVEARWASLRDWHIVDRTADHIRVWRSRAGDEAPQLMLQWPVGKETPRVAASRSLPAVVNFLHVHEFAFPVTVPQADGREWVLWSDARYCWSPDENVDRPLEPVITSGGTRLACALWAGGEFDRDGTALRQIVRVVGFTQAREPGA